MLDVCKKAVIEAFPYNALELQELHKVYDYVRANHRIGKSPS